jgi:excisionase family DNA binding protein
MMMTVGDVAEALNVSPGKVYGLIDREELGHNRIGKSIRISQTQFADYLKRTERPPRVPAAVKASQLEPLLRVSFEPPRTRGASQELKHIRIEPRRTRESSRRAKGGSSSK